MASNREYQPNERKTYTHTLNSIFQQRVADGLAIFGGWRVFFEDEVNLVTETI